ncbi:MAG TPA: urocanate hydratase [Saprospiraceae bacterium]|nr:urocanate hydratase [Saprospiraceae bacterium]HMQ81800.1 urocanate hydratase [Saprospiraceae bacterium]
MNDMNGFKAAILEGIPSELPMPKPYEPQISHAPKRVIDGVLTEKEKQLAIRNALRYFPSKHHAVLAPEFAQELKDYGRIYMHRFRPDYGMYARPIEAYPHRSHQAAAIMLMIQNNLDPKIAKHPHELITYGGNGAVFQNWAQYRLTMKYLAEMTDQQTLVMYSGHPLGLFPAHPDAPRVVVTNGMMIPNYSKKEDWNKYNALGVTSYGQMTAGSFMYIGPQGIVHGTTITLLNAGRMKGLGENNLKGKVYVTSGLGGMSGAQAVAAVVAGAVGVIAEVDPDAVQQRVVDGYIQQEHVFTNLDELISEIENCRRRGAAVALVYQGNIVDLWEKLVKEAIHIELGSDQTSLHNIEGLGYCPAGFTYAEAKNLLEQDEIHFMSEVRDTLRRHVRAINKMVDRGMYFWDYGNAFLKEAGNSGADIWKNQQEKTYKYPSYVEDIMGPLCFDYGFGPFRWVCTSGDQADLDISDKLAAEVLEKMIETAPAEIMAQLEDNLNWIKNAKDNIPVVGSLARILYADAEGRIQIARQFNEAIARGIIKGPIVLGRDHHDVSGTDSPFRETANIYDGSRFTADMAVHNVIGDGFRGATWVSLHNGGGVGWGEVINGGFGLVLDGTPDAERRLNSMLYWDVINGIARRSWARNSGAMHTAERAMNRESSLKITLPHLVDEALLEGLDLG